MQVMNRKRLLRVVGSIAFIALLASCATTGATSASASIERTVELFDTGTAGEIVAVCATPMLFDGEVVVRETDIRTVVSAVREASRRSTAGSIASIDGADRFASVFGTSFELDAFLRRYVPEDAVIVRIDYDSIVLSLLLGERSGGYRVILGMAVSS